MKQCSNDFGIKVLAKRTELYQRVIFSKITRRNMSLKWGALTQPLIKFSNSEVVLKVLNFVNRLFGRPTISGNLCRELSTVSLIAS